MKNLFEKETSNEFIGRINLLTSQTQAQWGKMNVAQMVTHCQKGLLVANGTIINKPNPLIKFLFGKSARKQTLEAKDFKKNLPTFAEAKIVDERIFETEKKKLIELIEKHQAMGPQGLTKNDHGFFGKMSLEDWNILQVKHLDHHLRQFGV